MKNRKRQPFQAMALVSIILSQLAGSILVGVFTGKWADQRFATEPLFLIIGLLLGLVAGIFAMLRTVHHFFSGD
ncbi:AtpZ/AtpI family protein [Priestia megaterium]|nr:AtpZ/AtpI family protein [Priestia megaterium]